MEYLVISFVIVIFAWYYIVMRIKYVLITLGGFVILLVVLYGTLYYRWRHLWALEKIHQSYQVQSHHDDTLRVVMIGDSWAGMHNEAGLDSLLQEQFIALTACPVVVKSRGRGGEKSRGIYNLMFEYGKYGTRQILSEGPDYCIVMAGINDAAANRGVRQYLYHYKLILGFLLSHNIRPVVVEIPDVNIWALYCQKPIKDLFGDYLKSVMTGCEMYNYHEYREALLTMLAEEDLMKKIVLIPMKEWNGNEEIIDESLFLEDQIHLNRKGYELLDSYIAFKIIEDYKSR